ncbi:MAG TPA: hypothetical protein DDZ51_05625 [Planctomycetaceae bacterium]|nr:hypothetical protein [Planctomycetaceae bacterium]
MNNTSNEPPAPFGDVDTDIEHGIFVVDIRQGRQCQLTLIGRTERGYPRTELATVSSNLWNEIGSAVEQELIRGMQDRVQEKTKQKAPTPKLRSGANALSTLITRELAVLLWALMEDETGDRTDALFAGWKQLASEERWWLYARASSPSQRVGQGWRHALLFALDDPAETRTSAGSIEVEESVELEPAAKKQSVRKRMTKNATAKKKSNTNPRTKVTSTPSIGSAADLKPKRTKKSKPAASTKNSAQSKGAVTKKTPPKTKNPPSKKPAAKKKPVAEKTA